MDKTQELAEDEYYPGNDYSIKIRLKMVWYHNSDLYRWLEDNISDQTHYWISAHYLHFEHERDLLLFQLKVPSEYLEH